MLCSRDRIFFPVQECGSFGSYRNSKARDAVFGVDYLQQPITVAGLAS
jgi:hypothetical protein